MADDVKPMRLRLSRAKGFDLQALSRATNGLAAVVVARPSRWGNPYKVGDPKWHPLTGQRIGALTAADAVAKFADRECGPTRSGEIARELRGRNLACWCADAPCHADVLLKLANSPWAAAMGDAGDALEPEGGRADGEG